MTSMMWLILPVGLLFGEIWNFLNNHCRKIASRSTIVVQCRPINMNAFINTKGNPRVNLTQHLLILRPIFPQAVWWMTINHAEHPQATTWLDNYSNWEDGRVKPVSSPQSLKTQIKVNFFSLTTASFCVGRGLKIENNVADTQRPYASTCCRISGYQSKFEMSAEMKVKRLISAT